MKVNYGIPKSLTTNRRQLRHAEAEGDFATAGVLCETLAREYRELATELDARAYVNFLKAVKKGDHDYESSVQLLAEKIGYPLVDEKSKEETEPRVVKDIRDIIGSIGPDTNTDSAVQTLLSRMEKYRQAMRHYQR